MSMKAPLWKLEGVASGTHNTPEQLRLPLNTTKGCQGTIHNMSLQNKDQTSSRISTCKYILVYTSMYAPAEFDSTQLASTPSLGQPELSYRLCQENPMPVLLEGSHQSIPSACQWLVASAELGGRTCTHIPTSLEKNTINARLAESGLGRDPGLENQVCSA